MLLHKDLQVTKIEAKRFMKWDKVEIDVPPAGIVVLTGDSGSGKTTILDAINWVISGSPLRDDASPRQFDYDGDVEVTIETPEIYATRTLRKSKSTLVWAEHGKSSDYTSSTLATNALQNLYGTPESWALRNIFTSTNLSFFSSNKDSDRKKFLESMLNVEVFEKPHARLLKRVSAGAKDLDDLRRSKAHVEGKIQALKEARDQASPPGERPPAPTESVADLKRQIKELTDKYVGDLKERVRDSEQEARRYLSWLDTLGDGTCPTCKGPVDEAHVEEHREALEAAKARAAKLKKRLHAAQDKEDGEREVLRARLDEALDQENALSEWAADKRRYEQARTTLNDKIAELEDEAKSIDLKIATQEADLAFLRKCAESVSTKGVRAWATSNALGLIEHYANAYLRTLGTEFRVRISPVRTLVNGNVVDEIDFKIDGAGRTFKASSEGERQRIGFAVRLAIATLWGGRGTMFMDEVYSHLDASHIEGFVNLIREVAAERAVVVITHDMAFAKALRGHHVHF